MKTTSYLLVSAILFAVVAIVHLFRLVAGWPVMLGATMVPLWVSVLAVLVTGAIAIWGFSLLRKTA